MKLRYIMTLIILTSVATSHNMDAASLWQRLKDMYNYRFPSLAGSAGFGYAAYAAQDPKYKILAGLCSAGLLKYACSVADTSTFEGLVAENIGFLSSYDLRLSSNNPGDAKTALIKDLQRAADKNQCLNDKINHLEQALDILFKKIEPVNNLKEGSSYFDYSLGRFVKVGEDKSNIEEEKYTKRLLLDKFFADPSKIQQKIDATLAQ